MSYRNINFLLIGILLFGSCNDNDQNFIKVDEVEIQVLSTGGFGTGEISLQGRVVNKSDKDIAKIIAVCMIQDSVLNTISEQYVYPVNSDFGNTLVSGESAIFAYSLKNNSENAHKIRINIIRIIPQESEPFLVKLKQILKRIMD